MLPTPTTASASRRRRSKNAWWITLSARTSCAASITHEMLRSDAPCAIALMLMLWRPSAPNSSARHAGPTLHAVADDGHDGLVRRMIEPRQLMLQLEAELPLRSRRWPSPRRRGGRRKQIVCSERRLRNQDDVDAARRQRPEQPLRRARHADHARAAQREQRDVVHRADPLGDRRLAVGRWLEMSVPGAAGIEACS